MREVTTPWPITEIMVTPEPSGRLRISDDIQQTLSSLFGYDGESRRPLRCGRTGTQFVASAPLANISKKPGIGANWTWNGGNIETSEVMILADSTNTGAVQVSIDAAVGATNFWPLNAGESLTFSVNNLSRVHINIVVAAEIAYVAYTR